LFTPIGIHDMRYLSSRLRSRSCTCQAAMRPHIPQEVFYDLLPIPIAVHVTSQAATMPSLSLGAWSLR
ncbi:hypothetical protein Pmar_PMAR028777, partial [Perkinsus marinus ATCC 50983]